MHLKPKDSSHLVGGEKYWLRVRPVNLIGNGVWSQWILFTCVVKSETFASKDSLTGNAGGSSGNGGNNFDRIIPNCMKIFSITTASTKNSMVNF